MYPEVVSIQPTADQDLGLTIAYRNYVNALRVEQSPPVPPPTPGAFFALLVLRALDSYAFDNVTSVVDARFKVAEADPQKRQAMAQAGGVDLVVQPPVVQVKP